MKQRKSDRRHSYYPCTFLSAILLTSCATAPPPKTAEVVDDALPESTEIRDDWAAGAGDSGRVDDGWIAAFGDATLDELVDEAIHNNLNLRLAASQVDRAAGLSRLAGAALKPAVGLGGGAGQTWAEQDLFSGNSYNAALSVNWEVDVWGKLRSRKAAGEAGLEAPLEREVVRAFLEGELGAAGAQHRYAGGRVTFCAMVPMRAVPFRVVALLGLNDRDFPRRLRRPRRKRR